MSNSNPPTDSKAVNSSGKLNLEKIAILGPNILFVIGLREQRVLFVNERVKQLLGHDASYIYEKGSEIFQTVIHPDDYERRMQNLEKCKELSNEEELEVEVRLQVANKEWQWFSITDKVFEREADGSVSQVIGTAQNIHFQKLYQERLKEEHRKLQNAQAIGHIGSFERKLPGERVTYSEEFYRILGIEPKEGELDLEEFMNHVHPQDRESYRAAIDHTHATGEPLDMVTRLIRPDGSVRFVHRRAAILKDKKGTPTRVYGTVQDITERVHAEKERKKFEWLMRSTEKVAATGSYEFNLETKEMYLSDGLYRLLDEEPGNVKPSIEWLNSLSHPEDADKVQQLIQDAIEQKKSFTYTRRIYCKNGQMRILEAQGNVLTDAEGNVTKIVGLVQNVTERKKAEEELRKSEKRSRNILNVLQNAPDAYLVLTPKLTIEMASDAYLKATNTTREEITGKYLFDAFPDNPDLPEATGVKDLLNSLRLVLSSKKPHRMHTLQYDLKNEAGKFEERYWSPVNSPVLNAKGEVEYIIHRALDVTDIEKKKATVKGLVNETEMLKTSLEKIKFQALQLKESRALLQSVFDASPNSLVLLKILQDKKAKVYDFEILMLNDYNYEKLAVSPKVIGKRFSEEFPEVRKNDMLNRFIRTAETGEPDDFETWYRSEEYDSWFYFRIRKLEDKLLVTSEDITERKKSEETLKQMFNGSFSAITMLDSIRDEQGEIIDFEIKGGNKAAEETLDVPIEKLKGKRLLDIWPGVKETFFDSYVKAVEGGDSVRTQKHYKSDGFDHWFDISATKNGDGIIMTFSDITEQKKVEQELIQVKEELAQKAEDRYRKIINSMDEAFCLIEIIFNENRECKDYRFLEINPVFEAQTGLKNPVGKTIKEMVPTIESYWLKYFGSVAKTGKSLRFEDFSEPLGRWFDIYAFRLDEGEEIQVGVIFTDITARKEAEDRQNFLLKLTDSLNPLVDPQEIIAAATKMVAQHFNAGRAYYYEIDENGWATMSKGYSADGKSIPKKFPVSHFGQLWLEAFQRGFPLAVGDIAKDNRFTREEKKNWREKGLSGGVGVPLLKKKKLISVLGLNNLKPRTWKAGEIKLLQEVHDRTWATLERAKIEKELKENEERLLQAMEAGSQFGWEVDLETGKVSFSGDEYAVLGFKLPATLKKKLSLIHPHDLENFKKAYRQSIRTKTSLSHVLRLLVPGIQGKHVWTRMEGNFFGTPPKFIGTIRNINKEKKAEERQAFLLDLSDALRAVDDPQKILYEASKILGKYLGAARVGYAEDMGDGEKANVLSNYVSGVSKIEGNFYYKEYGNNLLKELKTGNTVVQRNVDGSSNFSEAEREKHASLNCAATVYVPLVKKEVLHALFFIHCTKDHIFLEEDIKIIEETADRTWAAVERARAEKALREAQESLGIALEAAQMGTWILDLEKSSSERNIRHDQIFGYESPQTEWNLEISKKHIVTEDLPLYTAAFEEGKKTGKLSVEVRVRWQDDTIHWMAVNGHFYFDENGKAVRAAGVNFEITERRKAELALQESEQRFRNLVEASALAVWETDPEGKVTVDSPSWRNFTGQSYEEWIGTGWSNAVHPDDKQAVLQDWTRAVKARQNFDYEYRLRSSGGTYRWTNIKAIPILDQKGNVIKWTGMNLDIHDRKLTEEALRNAKEEAEAASRAKEDFVSTMSHEIRTPLNAIIGLTNLLMEQTPREDQMENLNSLSFSAKNLLVLINDILDFSKLEAGKMEAGENPFNLHDLLTNLQRAHKPQAETNGTDLILEIDDTIPSIIAADQVKLSQILHNLVSNAVKFTKRGLVKISVELCRKEQEVIWLNFSISDTGIGIESDKADHIFDKFAQAESSTVRNYGGTGLGLSITKLLLELLGSEIKLDSKLGEGSRFYFSLPVKEGDQEKLVEKEEIPDDFKDLSHLRLLLVEDVDINRKIIMQFLQNWWMLKPDEATNGKEAVAKAKNANYDLILMDVRMPEMDGYEATSKIRHLEGYENTPILALTADKNQEIQQEMQATMFSDMLTKPFDPEVLKSRILKHLVNSGKDLTSNGEIKNKISEEKVRDKNLEESSSKNPSFGDDSDSASEEAAFDISRYEKISDGNKEILGKLIFNTKKAIETYKTEFQAAAERLDQKALSDLAHKNTTSMYYIQANQLASKIENFRGMLKNSAHDPEELEKLKLLILKEFDKIIAGLNSMTKEE